MDERVMCVRCRVRERRNEDEGRDEGRGRRSGRLETGVVGRGVREVGGRK